MDLVVDTRSGPVEGREKNGVFLFAGIPYAAPPVGERRFMPPAPPEPWSEVRAATRFGKAAPQLQGGGMTDNAPVDWDEDCLFLNVQTPSLEGARPVLVWIHGGGYRTGQGAIPWYNGESFARLGDIVTVSINYRLGALGFTDLSRFGEEFESSGALGTLDQIAALQWVQNNIAAFGGDPSRVTIAGESAGGFSVGTLLASPLTRGMFRAAIPQSGAGHHTLPQAAAARVTDALLETLGVVDIDGLRGVSVDEILKAQTTVDLKLARDPAMGGVNAFYPVEGCPAIPVKPIDAIRSGAGSDVDVLIGTNKDEATLFIMERVSDDRPAKDAARYGGGDALLAAYRSAMPDADPTELATAMSTHWTFRVPAVRLAEARVENGSGTGRTWMYLFTWESRSRLKSTHALEIPFAFNNLDKPGVKVFLGQGPTPQGVADTMHNAWIRFINDGDPGWPAYDLDKRINMRFDEESGPVENPDAAFLDAWAGIR